MTAKKTYLCLCQDSLAGEGPKNETLAEHRKHCKAEKDECPFEKKMDDADAKVAKGGKRGGSAITPEMDAAYADAVKRGDKKTLRTMVNRAAGVRPATLAETGVPITVEAYHGTPSFGFTVFDPSKSDDGKTLFFTDDIHTATSYHGGEARTRIVTNKAYEKVIASTEFTDEEIRSATPDNIEKLMASRGFKRENDGHGWVRYEKDVTVRGRNHRIIVQDKFEPWEILHLANVRARSIIPSNGNYHVAVSMRNPCVIEGKTQANGVVESEAAFEHFLSLGIKCSTVMNTRHWAYAARDAGYDGVVFRGLYDNGGKAESGEANIIVAFSPNQVKSLDLATYDDAGNLIPLSKRFNMESADIRDEAKGFVRKYLEEVGG